MFTKEEIEAMCLEDFKKYEGKIVKTHAIVISGGLVLSHERGLMMRVRVLSDDAFRLQWYGDSCEPLWDVNPLDQHPELAEYSPEFAWIKGPRRWLNGDVGPTNCCLIPPHQN
jgi:hypothetical protein